MGAIRIMYPDNANNGGQMYVEEVSTRKVKNITEELCGTSFFTIIVENRESPYLLRGATRRGGEGE